MEYAQYDQPPNQHFKVPHLQSAILKTEYGSGQWRDMEGYSSGGDQHNTTPMHEYTDHHFETPPVMPIGPSFTVLRPPSYTAHQQLQPLHPLITMAQWPSILTTQSGYSPPVQGTAPMVTPISARTAWTTVTPVMTTGGSTPRRTLTDDDRRRMCEYHESHPNVKQTEIGAMFGVERSTVSKVLRQKEKILYSKYGSQSPAKKAKGKFPDIERALADWAKNEQIKGEILNDAKIKERLDILSEAATPTKPLPLTSQTLNKDLPIGIKGKKLNASADTGSDECGMPRDIADLLNLKVRCAPSDIKEFEIGNGRKIKSIGRTTVDCSFWNEPGKKLRCVFYVFERLIVPLIMGRDFLERTDTLTQRQDRLVDRAPRTGSCRVMHLSRPKRRMRCYIDSELVEANPDTGAEMELVSPDFIKRKGYAVDAPDAAHEEVQFVDGSTARTQGQVTIKFEAYGDAFQEAVPSKARYRTFYVLDGLTTDILLGEDLLYSINAFTEHASSFVDLGDFSMHVELKGIVWLDRAEQRLARIFGGDLPGSSTTLASGSAGINIQSRMQRFTSLIGRATGARTRSEAIRTARRELDFERDVDNRDARENARQEAADLRINRLSPSQRATAEEQEKKVRQAFDDDQRQRRQQHEAALATAVRHVPMA